MNSFEISILRILLKRNGRPIPVFALIEGFPNDSEINVIEAMDHLQDLGFVHVLSGFPKEEEYISFNPLKRGDILQLVISNTEPKEINSSISEIPNSSLKNKSQEPLPNSSGFKRKMATSTTGIVLVMAIAAFLVAGPLIFQIPSANNKIASDSNPNPTNNYFNYHDVFGDKQRQHSEQTLNTVDDRGSASRLILTTDGIFMNPYSCIQS